MAVLNAARSSSFLLIHSENYLVNGRRQCQHPVITIHTELDVRNFKRKRTADQPFDAHNILSFQINLYCCHFMISIIIAQRPNVLFYVEEILVRFLRKNLQGFVIILNRYGWVGRSRRQIRGIFSIVLMQTNNAKNHMFFLFYLLEYVEIHKFCIIITIHRQQNTTEILFFPSMYGVYLLIVYCVGLYF